MVIVYNLNWQNTGNWLVFTDTEIGKRRSSIDETKEPSIYKDPTVREV